MRIKLHKDNSFSQDTETYLVITKEGLKIQKEITKRYDYDLEQKFDPITKQLSEVMTYKSKSFTEEIALF